MLKKEYFSKNVKTFKYKKFSKENMLTIYQNLNIDDSIELEKNFEVVLTEVSFNNGFKMYENQLDNPEIIVVEKLLKK